jgi:threonine dehydrogenase-like Zn-dependent dehydrogenase
MHALWLENQTLSLRSAIPVPIPAPGEALIRILKAGICNTDIELAHGYYPFKGVLGHEFVGVVESEGEWRSARVCGEINLVCGTCEQCRAGRRSHCDNRTVLGVLGHDGAFTEYLTLPYANLHRVPDSVCDEVAVFTEPLAAAFEILEQVPITASDTVYVVGDGKLGNLCAQVLKTTGCQLMVLGKHDNKLSWLAAHGIRTALISQPPQARADVVVECTGSPLGFDFARHLTRPRGTLVLKSTYAGRLSVDMSRVAVDEIHIVGSRCGPFPRALDALANGKVDVRPLIHARYPLAEALAAMDHAQRPGVLKVLLEMSE